MTPSKILQGRSPYEVLFGKKPHYGSLRVFGSLCYVHRKDQNRDKFSPRSRRCMFLGYPFGKKGWRVYDLETNKFFVSRDVVFKEDVFPYENEVSAPVDEKKLTGGRDDDRIIYSVSDTEDRGSDPIIKVSTTTEKQNKVSTEMVEEVNVSEPVGVKDIVTANQDTTQVVTESDDVIKSSGTQEVTTEPEIQRQESAQGRGLREKIPSVRLRDYVSYNAACLETPHHELTSSDPEPSPTVSGTSATPYLVVNYISDEKISESHKAFLAAITKGGEPRSYKEAVEH